MPIARDATGHGSTASANSLTYSHTCTGTNRILWVSVLTGNNFPTVTYAGASMTQVGLEYTAELDATKEYTDRVDMYETYRRANGDGSGMGG
jgi:hypothetical protein